VVTPPTEVVEFLRTEPEPVVRHMERLQAAHRGWINLRPQVRDEEEAEERPSGVLGAFSSAGPPVPLCTWTAGEQRRRGLGPSSIGVQHASGPKAARRLAELGAPVPQGWQVVQDHPRRGLVVRPPAEEPLADVLTWLLWAGQWLCGPAVTGWWKAAVYDPG
jgi:hypothetical protein